MVPKKWYNEIENWISVVILGIMLVILSYQVFMRYIFTITYGWIDEVARYFLIYFAFITASVAILFNEHIKIDIFLKVWPRSWRHKVKLFSHVIFFVYCIVMIYYGSQLTLSVLNTGTISQALGFPMWWVYGIIPLSHFVMALRLIQLELRLIRNPELLRDQIEINLEKEAAEAAGQAEEKTGGGE